MPHIHTDPGHHDHTVSGLIFRIDGDEPRVLLHRHKTLKKYMQFGGHIELDENPWQTLEHELLDESGYELSQLKLLQPYKRLKQFGHGVLHPVPLSYGTFTYSDIDHKHTDIDYAFVTLEEPAYKPAEGESGDIRLFTKDEVLALTDDEVLANVKELVVFAVEECLPHWEMLDPLTFTQRSA